MKTTNSPVIKPFWLSMTKLPSSFPVVILYVIPSPSGSFASTVATKVLGPASSETNVRYLIKHTKQEHNKHLNYTHGENETHSKAALSIFKSISSNPYRTSSSHRHVEQNSS